MANNLGDLKDETLNKTPGNMQAEVQVEKKADTLKKVQALTLGNTLVYMEAMAIK